MRADFHGTRAARPGVLRHALACATRSAHAATVALERGEFVEHRGGAAAPDHESNRRQMAAAVRGAPTRGALRRAAGRRTAHDPRRGGRDGDRADARDDAEERDALEHADDGGEGGDESRDDRENLADVRPEAPSDALLQAAPDPQLIDKVRDVVGLYMHPPRNAVVFSFDEKSQIQALQRAQPFLSMDLGQPERQTYTTCAMERSICLRPSMWPPAKSSRGASRSIAPKISWRSSARSTRASRPNSKFTWCWIISRPTKRRRCIAGYSVIRASSCTSPTYASWLNLVERFFGLLTANALKRSSTSVPQLRDAILQYVDAHNEQRKPFKWTKTADEILEKMGRFGIRTQQVHGK